LCLQTYCNADLTISLSYCEHTSDADVCKLYGKTGSKKGTKTKGKSSSEDNIDIGLIKSDYIDPMYHRRVPWLHIDITHGTIDDSVIGVEHPSVWVRFRRILAKRSKQKDFDEHLKDEEVPEVCL
jgi:hypothetical protein